MKSRLIQFAFIFLSFLSNLITAQVEPFQRIYFTPIVYNDLVYILGGNYSSAQVPVLNITNGIDANNPDWSFTQGISAASAGISGYLRGTAFKNSKNDVFVHAGNTSSELLRDLIKYNPSIDGWTSAIQVSSQNRPPQASMMTATWNPKDDAAYYYGGQPLTLSGKALSTFTKYDTISGTWSSLSPQYPNAHRPGRAGHSANIINNQMFIMGGVTQGANTTIDVVQADFESVLVYDIANNTAVTVATLGDIPSLRQAYSTALGLDGRSIVLYGGYSYDDDNKITFPSNDIYVLDTCTLTWTKKSVGGNAPGSLYGHGAITINNYMVLMMGMTSQTNYNEKIYILDLANWKWVTSFTSTSNTINTGVCQFPLPSVDATNFYPFNYDFSVLDNPLRPKSSSSGQSKGLGIGFGLLAILLIVAGFYLYRRRMRNKHTKRTLNPRWMRNVPTHNSKTTGAFGDDRDYPLFVYNKELDADNPNNPNIMTKQHDVRTYTASDHEQWEQQLMEEGTQGRHNDIWNRMRGLNHDTTTYQDISHRRPSATNDNRLLDV